MSSEQKNVQPIHPVLQEASPCATSEYVYAVEPNS